MNPFFFGSSRRQLFGAYDPPREGGRRGAVLCYPLAREYLLAHPTFRHLARLLSSSGWHVLRFDYYGTGDSAGDFEDAGRDLWLADIETAIDELKDISQLARVSLIGMRYGAVLAAMAARRRRDVESLVLWDPVPDGRAYLSELGVTSRTEGASSGAEADGAVFSDRLLREIQDTTATSVPPQGLPRTLVLGTCGPIDAFQALHTHLATGGADCSLEHVPDVPVWREEWGRGGVGMAVAAATRIVTWMS